MRLGLPAKAKSPDEKCLRRKEPQLIAFARRVKVRIVVRSGFNVTLFAKSFARKPDGKAQFRHRLSAASFLLTLIFIPELGHDLWTVHCTETAGEDAYTKAARLSVVERKWKADFLQIPF
jgi:hypothetical protein